MFRSLLLSTALLLPVMAHSGSKIIDEVEVETPSEVITEEAAEATAEVIAEILPDLDVPDLAEDLAELSTVEPGSEEALDLVSDIIDTVLDAAEELEGGLELNEVQAEVAINLLETLISAAPAGSETRVKLEAIRNRLRAG